ncbi:MAG: high-affinity iron transporter [Oceanicoccus sp.]|jgi:high-affinity iron transporter
MLTTSVIIILREVLEISLMVSIMLAVSRKLEMSLHWFFFSVLAGVTGSFGYAASVRIVSNSMDGIGQEITDASIQILTYVLTAIVVRILLSPSLFNGERNKLLMLTMSACVFTAITREGYEIVIYVGGFISEPSTLLPVAIGSIIGAGIGMSIGAIFYYALVSIGKYRSVKIYSYALILVASGLLLQASLLLTQADILPSQDYLWDTSGLISEYSITGQMLYALLGYEATPTPAQVAIYIGGIIFLTVIGNYTNSTNPTRGSQ